MFKTYVPENQKYDLLRKFTILDFWMSINLPTLCITNSWKIILIHWRLCCSSDIALAVVQETFQDYVSTQAAYEKCLMKGRKIIKKNWL